MMLLVTGYRAYQEAFRVLKVADKARSHIHVVTPRQGVRALEGIDPVLVLITYEGGWEMKNAQNNESRLFREALTRSPQFAATPQVEI